MPVLGVIAAGALIAFLVIVLIAAVVYFVLGWFRVPHPIPAIIAAIIVLVGVADLLGQ